MNFRVKRLHGKRDSFRGYHLFDEEGTLILVADYGTPWVRMANQEVRFAQSDGSLVATMSLMPPVDRGKFGRKSLSYAVVRNHAVYTVINEFQEEEERPYFILEVEQLRWLVALQTEKPEKWGVYDDIPANTRLITPANLLSFSEPVGEVQKTAESPIITLALPPAEIKQPALVMLALVFLLDKPG